MPVAKHAAATAHDNPYQAHRPPSWQIQVHLGTNGAIRSAKIYKQGSGAGERHFTAETTTVMDVLDWANNHVGGSDLTASHVVLA